MFTPWYDPFKEPPFHSLIFQHHAQTVQMTMKNARNIVYVAVISHVKICLMEHPAVTRTTHLMWVTVCVWKVITETVMAIVSILQNAHIVK